MDQAKDWGNVQSDLLRIPLVPPELCDKVTELAYYSIE